MDKYLGIIKKETKSAIGIDIKILTKFSNSKKTLRQPELESFFKDFEDCSPVTEQEKKEAEKLYENIMKDEQEEYCVEEKDEEGHYHCPICYAYVYTYEHSCCECGAKIKFIS